MHQLTAPELEILKLLWEKQPLTSRELHDELAPLLGWGYSSTRKTLERMSAKGIVACDSLGNQNCYRALLEKMPTLAAYAQDFARRVFEINGPLPVAMFANSKLLKQDEIADLEQLLQQLAAAQPDRDV
ncbi:MAG: BlaI/MecI/CopY family transcriptional regulator [Gammaproteobacteria bacterium]|nr:BlaI/MecI/CopY family transcriptional regulator [Gammaproteobacteria bacterium]MBU1554110.1 BlaI/MecI/CopY family transcriptional regulator [Gammaproteobacteria bacterium]MBU2072210.1 BlaI/MecI/CopY family transcriptional regulator [Gammaproteobacteria bacterium]MBU2182072.1 BlaI/MecI/CopY family transcriptional regulator [Gammaproteobacteria bacterium]MBU2203915.1 BlaI/MecI/CopY family transcriptional regulator [Gammaproteobacteria bacterium]